MEMKPKERQKQRKVCLLPNFGENDKIIEKREHRLLHKHKPQLLGTKDESKRQN